LLITAGYYLPASAGAATGAVSAAGAASAGAAAGATSAGGGTQPPGSSFAGSGAAGAGASAAGAAAAGASAGVSSLLPQALRTDALKSSANMVLLATFITTPWFVLKISCLEHGTGQAHQSGQFDHRRTGKSSSHRDTSKLHTSLSA
jgi:hypothetical protein